jgi:hypothetical protein
MYWAKLPGKKWLFRSLLGTIVSCVCQHGSPVDCISQAHHDTILFVTHFCALERLGCF